MKCKDRVNDRTDTVMSAGRHLALDLDNASPRLVILLAMGKSGTGNHEECHFMVLDTRDMYHNLSVCNT